MVTKLRLLGEVLLCALVSAVVAGIVVRATRPEVADDFGRRDTSADTAFRGESTARDATGPSAPVGDLVASVLSKSVSEVDVATPVGAATASHPDTPGLKAVFDEERRSSTWAARTELTLNEQLAKYAAKTFDGAAPIVAETVECRTGICKIGLRIVDMGGLDFDQLQQDLMMRRVFEFNECNLYSEGMSEESEPLQVLYIRCPV